MLKGPQGQKRPAFQSETLPDGTAETGQLTKAHDDKETGFAIINACEVRDATITARLNRPWWRTLLPG